MLGKRSILMFTCVMLILAGFLPLITNAGAEEGTRAPPVITGTITTDATWSEDVILDGVTIADGVTVTVDPGVNIFMVPLDDLYIRGTLRAIGTQQDPINVSCSVDPGTWNKIQVETTGSLYLENFTIDEGSIGQTWLVQANGDCYLKHGLINGGYQGYHATGPGDLLMEDIEFANCEVYGLVILSHTGQKSIEGINIHDTMGGIGVADAGPFEVSDIMIRNISLYEAFHIEGDTEAVFRNFSVRSDVMSATGVGSYNSNNHIRFVNGQMNDLDFGFKLNNGADSIIEFDDVHFLDNINNLTKSNPYAGFHSVFTNCSLNAKTNLFDLNGTNSMVNVDLVNTTYDKDAIWNLVGENTWVNISYYMDLDITDHAGNPLDSKFSYKRAGETSYTEINSPDGQFDTMLFPDRYVQGDRLPTTILHELKFEAVSDPTATITLYDYNINRYSYRWMRLNLEPTNDLPETLNIDEDEWFDINLTEYFTDPDGLPFVFDAISSDSITLESEDGPNTGLYRMKNSEENWNGDGWVVFSGQDSGLRRTEKNVTITVQPVNDPPELELPDPHITTPEDTPVDFCLEGKLSDIEGSEIEITFPEGINYTTEYNATSMNLTIIPAEDFYGVLDVLVNLSDGENIVQRILPVNVTPINDLPEVSVMVGDQPLAQVPYQLNDTVEIIVYELLMDEDSSVDFWLDAIDVDSVNLTYFFNEEDLLHGSIAVETHQVEVIVNETTNETEMQDVIVPMNFTYTPLSNDNNGDLVLFNVNDGDGQSEVWVWFNVIPVNDPIEFNTPDEWNITVELNVPMKVDIGGMISDIDGDTISVTTSSEFFVVNGSVLEILYNENFTGEMESVEITISDGETEMTGTLIVNVDRVVIDDEPILGEMEVTAKEDKWIIEVDGSEGQDLWVVVETDDGNVTSFRMTYSNGVYSVEIPDDDAEEGLKFWISDVENGDPAEDNFEEFLPLLKEDEDDPFPFWIIILLIIVVLLIIIILVIVVTSNRSEEYYDEE